jgi:hypothetical protein
MRPPRIDLVSKCLKLARHGPRQDGQSSQAGILIQTECASFSGRSFGMTPTRPQGPSLLVVQASQMRPVTDAINVEKTLHLSGEWLKTWERRYFYILPSPSARIVYSIAVRPSRPLSARTPCTTSSFQEIEAFQIL